MEVREHIGWSVPVSLWGMHTDRVAEVSDTWISTECMGIEHTSEGIARHDMEYSRPLKTQNIGIVGGSFFINDSNKIRPIYH